MASAHFSLSLIIAPCRMHHTIPATHCKTISEYHLKQYSRPFLTFRVQAESVLHRPDRRGSQCRDPLCISTQLQSLLLSPSADHTGEKGRRRLWQLRQRAISHSTVRNIWGVDSVWGWGLLRFVSVARSKKKKKKKIVGFFSNTAEQSSKGWELLSFRSLLCRLLVCCHLSVNIQV